MVRGTTRGLASYNLRNPNAIHNKRKDCNYNKKLSQRKDEDEVPLELLSKRLQALHCRGLIQFFVTFGWNPSSSPKISLKDPRPNLTLGFYFVSRRLMHGRALGYV